MHEYENTNLDGMAARCGGRGAGPDDGAFDRGVPDFGHPEQQGAAHGGREGAGGLSPAQGRLHELPAPDFGGRSLPAYLGRIVAAQRRTEKYAGAPRHERLRALAGHFAAVSFAGRAVRARRGFACRRSRRFRDESGRWSAYRYAEHDRGVGDADPAGLHGRQDRGL